MNSIQEEISKVRLVWYGLPLAGTLVLGLLLLFLPELPNFLRRAVLPALVVYTMGTALLGHIQLNLTVRRDTKRAAEGKDPAGIEPLHLSLILVTHVVWFAAFAGLLAWRYLFS